SGKVATNTALGDKVLTVVASDKTTPTNTTTVKFKLDVKAQNEKYTPTAGTTPVAVNNIGSISPSDLEKIKNSVTVPNLSQEARNSGGVTTSLKNHGAVTTAGGKKYVTVEVTYPDGSKDEVPVEVQQNTNVVKRPIINLKQGETLSAAEMKTIVELQDGSSKLPLPADAVVTATFNTNTVKDGNWTNITVRFNDGTTKTVRANYNVKATFPVANTVYDFRGVTRTNDSESNYYINKGLPNGMSWFVKKGTENKRDARIQTYLATDGLGRTDYTFGAYYAASRFNDNESNVNLKLKHEGTVSHHVYDVMAAANKITVNNGATLTEANAKAAVTKVAGSEDLPAGTTYEWVADENGTALTNKTVTEFGEATRYVKVTLPKSQETSDNSPAATQRQSSKIIRVTVKVNETVKPTVKLVQNNQDITLSESTTTNALPKVTVYRGEKAEITVKASDNTGKLSRFATSGLPSGVTETGASSSDSATDAAPLAHTLSGKVATN
ncbi:MAG: Rib/alpha-like domain-containing protein, partial [Streptococcus mitis]|nr:Rib/alpha-like domain-containing protein [Streptococcus mitis]